MVCDIFNFIKTHEAISIGGAIVRGIRLSFFLQRLFLCIAAISDGVGTVEKRCFHRQKNRIKACKNIVYHISYAIAIQ
jgi:hypothetical protein